MIERGIPPACSHRSSAVEAPLPVKLYGHAAAWTARACAWRAVPKYRFFGIGATKPVASVRAFLPFINFEEHKLSAAPPPSRSLPHAFKTHGFNFNSADRHRNSSYAKRLPGCADHVLAVATLCRADSANQMMVQLNWVDVPGETGFILERRSSTAASFAEVAKIGQDVKTYKDVTTASQNYEYRLRAYKVRGGQIYYSQYTNTVSVQTGTTGTTSTTTGTTDTTTTGTTTGTTDTTTTGTTTGTTDTTTTGTTNDPC